MSFFYKSFLIYTIILSLNSAGKAQQLLFEPFPQNNMDAYHLNFKQYFLNEKEEKEDLERFYSNLDRFNSFKNKSSLSARNLIVSLKLQDSILIQFFKHDIYFDLLASVDRKNSVYKEACNKVEADFSEKTAFFEKELTTLSNTTLEKYFKEEPQIEKYRFYITDLLRNHRDSFCKNYATLLKNGFNASPRVLLKHYLGIDIDNPDLVKDAISVIKIKVGQLEELYK